MMVDEAVGQPPHAPANMNRDRTITPTFGTRVLSIANQDASCSSGNDMCNHKNPPS